MTKLLLVGGGSSYSVFDVEQGYRKALTAAGHNVGYYALDQRIAGARDFLTWRSKHSKGAIAAPTSDEILTMASEDIVWRAAYYKPEWVVFVAGRLAHPGALLALRNVGIQTALLSTENPYDDAHVTQLATLFTVVFVNERCSVPIVAAGNPNTHYLGHAFDPDRHHPGANGTDESAIPAHDVLFVGTDFSERCRTLAAVDWTGIDLGLYGDWRYGKRSRRLRPHIKGGIQPNATTAALYRRARIGLNLYRTGQGWARDSAPVERAESLNPRALELAACGVFTLSDYRAEVAEIFGDVVPTFETPAELEELVRYYLSHDAERRALAERLPGCVAGHTYAARAAELMGVLSHV